MAGRVLSTLAAAGVAALAISTAAQAADPDFCRNYADNAVGQAREAERLGCGYLLNRGGRWHFDYDRHYGWCLGVSRDEANAERLTRRDALLRCSGR